MAGAMLLVLVVRPLFRVSPLSFASQFQCAFRFNSYIGLAVAGSVYGAPGLALTALLFGAMIPMVNQSQDASRRRSSSRRTTRCCSFRGGALR